eukprot:CAMPEP_0178429312 /NCGR_PEP_ID=MMETSP0689_2-20121128/30735_1 /TAXON_ID=160604 /ORGANISM="Amphidinium massartii, Strain CS-259" /LENGTH=456 /DNA_ID=CAMNT_0020051125 /DNA_START=114 /DNA_END=1484 /DNA_ORIENTATION=+
MVNAVSIAISAHFALEWALENPGGKKAPQRPWEEVFAWVFLIFYSLELLLRASAQGYHFLCGKDWHWNVFDLILVVMVIYEQIVAALVTNLQSINVGWLRVLRLMKMMKIFRVVRLMRFFRVLRLIVSQIAGSMMMLFWASLVLFIMIFLFALCFAHGVTEYLLETPQSAIPGEAMGGIGHYWSSLGTSMTSLYLALAGGTDWEDIAAPLKASSGLYYGLFLFYIGFSFISVVNVVTSLFVDSALKISEQDESAVQTALAERDEVTKLRKYYRDRDEDETGLINWQGFKRSLRCSQMSDFLRCLSMTLVDVKRIFKILQRGGNVDIEEFMTACIKVVDDTKAIDIVQLQAEARRNTSQIGEMFEFFEDRFQALHLACQAAVGADAAQQAKFASLMSPAVSRTASRSGGLCASRRTASGASAAYVSAKLSTGSVELEQIRAVIAHRKVHNRPGLRSL